MAKKSNEEKEQLVLLANTREVLKTAQGKDVIWAILGMCDIYGYHFTGDNRTYHNEGKREVGLEVLRLLQDADPTAYARLILEKQKIEVDSDD